MPDNNNEIVRDNPFPEQASQPASPPASQQGQATIPEVPIQGNPITNTAAQVIQPGNVPPVTTPLSNQGLANEQIGSAEDRKTLTAQLAQQQSEGAANEAAVTKDAAADNLQNQQLSAAALKKAMGDADARDTALRLQIKQQAAQHVDPERWWNHKSTGGKVEAGIGIILGGLGQGLMKRGDNPAITQINNAINNDIAAQKSDIENSWKGIAATHELDDNAFNRELHNQTWQNNYRTAGLERVKLQLASAASTTQSQVVKQNALIGIQDLTDQQAKIRNQQYLLGQQAAMTNLTRMRKLQEEAGKSVEELVKDGATQENALQSVYTRPEYRELLHAGMAPQSVAQNELLRNQFQSDVSTIKQRAKAAGIDENSPSFQQMVNQVQNNPKYAPLMKEENQGQIVPKTLPGQFEQQKDLRERTITIDGKQYQANSAKQAEEAAVAINAAKEVKRINNRIQELTNENGPLGPEKRAELDSLMDQGALHFPRMQTGSARVNDTEIQMGKDTYTNKGNWLRTDMLGRQKGHLASINTQADDRMRDALQGLTPLNVTGPGNAVPVPNPPGSQPPASQAKPSVQQMNQMLGAKPVKGS